MAKFAKLFDITNIDIFDNDERQLLVRKMLNPETNVPEVVMSTDTFGAIIKVTFAFNNDKSADKYFKTFDQDKAIRFTREYLVHILSRSLDEDIDETITLEQKD